MRRKGLKFIPNLTVAIVCLIVLLPGQTAFTQTVNGGFHGVVADSSGAVIPNATVVAQNAGTNMVRQATTDDVGFYTILQLPPGRYVITASKSGFSTSQRDNVQLVVNQDLAVDFTLQVSAITQKVEITGTPAALDTASATIGQVVGSQETVQLPLNGRQFTQLVLLTPGAAPYENGQQSGNFVAIGAGGISPSVDGERSNQNNFTLDGGLNNYLMNNGWIISPPPDAIQEFKVQSHIVDAQFGISAGANVNLVTKSGSNQLHGNAYEFLRNDKMDATNFFTNFASQPKAPFQMNQYGVTLGGPVQIPGYNGREKKTYFFGYWEGFRSHQGFTESADVPPAADLGGNFSDILTTTKLTTDALGRPVYTGEIYNPYSTRTVTAGAVDSVTGLTATSTGPVRDPFPGNAIPANMLNQAALTYLKAFYPAADYGTGTYPNYFGPSLQIVRQDQFGVKMDHTFSNNDNLTGGFYFRQSIIVAPNALKLGNPQKWNDARVVNLNYTHLFSPTLLATFHYQYVFTWFNGANYQPAGEALLDATNLNRFEPVANDEPEVPAVSISPRFTGTAQSFIANAPDRTHNLTVDIQKVDKSHTLSGGYMIYKIHTFVAAGSGSVGFNQIPSGGIAASGANQLSGDGLASMLLDVPYSLSSQVGNVDADNRTTWQGGYIQDKWQVTKRLNVSFGMRYDYVAPMTWANNQVSGPSVQCMCFLISQPYAPLFPFANVRPTFLDPDYHGFQPRFGIAYGLSPKTVLRTSFSIFDDHNNTLKQATQALRIKWPWGGSASGSTLNLGYPTTLFDNLPLATTYYGPGSGVTASFGEQNHKPIAYSMEWNFGIQREITTNLTAEVDYVGSGSRHTNMEPSANTVPPNLMGAGATAPRFPFYAQYPSIGVFSYEENEGKGDYNSLQAKLQRRFAAGVTFLASYTWSKSLDLESSAIDGSIETFYNIEKDYGPSTFNFPQIFVFSSVYQLPWGKGKRFGHDWSGPLNAVAGGWQMSGIVTARSGSPFSVTVGDIANVGGGSQRANIVGSPLPAGFTQTVQQWYSKSAFATPANYTFGNLARNTLRGPDDKGFDFNLMKDFHLTETKYLEVRGDFFNIFNNVNFANPSGSEQAGSFMTISSAGASRQIQISLKLQW
jgi:hypothetical protein